MDTYAPYIYTWIVDLSLKLYNAAIFFKFSLMMTLYTFYMQPSYGTNQTDLQMEITLVWFSDMGKRWWSLESKYFFFFKETLYFKNIYCK